MQKSLCETDKHQPAITLHVPCKIKFIHFWGRIKAYVAIDLYRGKHDFPNYGTLSVLSSVKLHFVRFSIFHLAPVWYTELLKKM